MSLNKKNVLLFFIFAAGLSLRLYRIGANDLWYDEAVSFALSKNLDPFYIVYHDFHPPLYHLVLSCWINLFGVSEFILRLLSVVFSLAAIPIIYKIGRTILNHSVGILAALIFTLSPFQIWYAQEARSYAMSVFLVSLAVMFLAQILYEDKRYLWKYFIIISSLSILTEYINLLVLFSFTPLFFLRRDLLKRWLISWMAIFLAFLYPLSIKAWGFIEGGFWIDRPTILSVIDTFKRFSLGYESTLSVSALILFGCFALFGAFKLLRQRSKLIFIVSPIFITSITVFVISRYLPVSIYLDRQLLPVSIFYYLLISAGISMVNTKAVKAFALVMIIIFNIFSLNEYYAKVLPKCKKPFKPLIEFINKHRNKDDILVFGTKVMRASIGCYYLRDMDSYFFIEERDYIMTHPVDYNFSKALTIIKSLEDMQSQDIKKVWLLTGCWERDGRIDDSSRSAKRWVSRGGSFLKSKAFDGIFVDLFELNKRNSHEE
ncbi:MAG: glycosyltransferase family 39 protein [Candidatus Omnitrophica bacterium]|nr:glycosyltransferase family 39 protein [Candidatus Omnitrophota bacterium]